MTTQATPDGYLTTEEVAKLFPAENGKTTHVNTVNAWITKGVNGVRLQAWKPGKRYYTTADAVQAFLVALTDAKDRRVNTAAASTNKSAARRKAARAAAIRHGLCNR